MLSCSLFDFIGRKTLNYKNYRKVNEETIKSNTISIVVFGVKITGYKVQVIPTDQLNIPRLIKLVTAPGHLATWAPEPHGAPKLPGSLWSRLIR